MDLRKLADEMKGTAWQNPHNQDRQFIMPVCCARQVKLDGRLLNIGFTYNVWDSMPAKCWQLSVHEEGNGSALPDSVVKPIVEMFLGTEGYEEFTNKMPPQMRHIRQFMKRAQ